MIRRGRIEQRSTQPEPRDVLMDWFTQDDLVSRWMGVGATVSAEPGATYSCLLPEGQAWDGVVVEAEPPVRLVHTLGWRDPSSPLAAGMSLVTWEFAHDSAGSRIVLLHEHVPRDLLDFHNHVWSHLLARLRSVLAGRPPGPHPLQPRAAQGTALGHSAAR